MRIVSVTSIRDEGPFLLEWLAWHRLLGVSDFLIWSNDCRDGSDLMLDRLAAAGVVQHFRNPAQGEDSIQWQALNAAWAHPLRKTADWMLISDLDEFPMIHTGAHGFADLFAALPAEVDAVALAWRLFGHGGRVNFTDQPVVSQFLHSAPPDMLHPVASTFFKSLFRPRAFQKPGVHRPKQRPRQPLPHWVDGSGRPLPDHLGGSDKRLSLIPLRDHRHLAEMHHYSLRSAESFLVKSGRGLPNRSEKQLDLSYWVERNFNTVENRAALALADPLAREIAALKALPGVGALHDAACLWHQQEVQRLLATPAGYRLFCTILHVGQSLVLPDRLSRQLLQQFARLGAGDAG